MKPHKYLEPTDAGAFDGFVLRVPERNLTQLCPTCLGHGGWNLELDAYGKGRHFQAHCSSCNGWGYLKAGERPHDVVKRELQEKYKPILHVTHCGSSSVQKTCIIETHGENVKDIPDDAFLMACDGWWMWNFGGVVKRDKETPYRARVTVYTD